MDPLGVVTTLISLTHYLITVAEKVQQNSEECKCLAKHADEVVQLIQSECKDGVPDDLKARLIKLSNTIKELTDTLDELDTKPWLMKVLWRGDVSDRIAKTYKTLSETMQLCKIGMSIDMRRIMQEHEEARRMDTLTVVEKLDQGLWNDHEIISRLEVQGTQVQEAMIAIHKKLQDLEKGSAERPLLEKGMHAMQRRSGAMQLAPDEFVITSLDVIVRKDEKLGEGGFGQVFRGDWQGVAVAVKVFEKGIPQPILQKELDVWKRLRHPHILQFHGACSIADPPFAVCAYKSNGDALVYLTKHQDADRLKLLHDASLGLRYLHSYSVVHGDLKASNILIDEHGRACLADFGLSKVKTFTTTVRTPVADAQFGTARWMAPEQMTLGVINSATDVYSFGMTMYEVFAGLPPFANTPNGLLMNVVVDRGLRPPRPDGYEVRKQGLGNRMWELLETCWSAEPKNRPSARTISTRIEACQKAATLTTQRAQKPPQPVPISTPYERNHSRPHAAQPSNAVPPTPAPPTSSGSDPGPSYVASPPLAIIPHPPKPVHIPQPWMPSHQPRLVFGSPLRDSLKFANVQISTANANGMLYVWGYIPVVIAKCGLYLKERATEVEGIFQVDGSHKRMSELQALFEMPPRYGRSIDWNQEKASIHDIANIFRRYLAQMSEPVIPTNMYYDFRDTLAKQPYNEDDAIATYKRLVHSMPRANQYLLLYVLDLLSIFARKSEKNRMDASKLAMIFRPGMLSHPAHEMEPKEHPLTQRVLEFLIAKQDWFMLEIQSPPSDDPILLGRP